MKVKSLLLFLSAAIMFASCRKSIQVSTTVYDSDSVQSLDFNAALENSIYSAPSILDSVAIVNLETNGNSLVSNVMNIVISDGRIFIHDDYQMGGVIIFGEDGHFIRRLANGNGPGEIPNLVGIAYDEFQRHLLVYGARLMVYDKDGNYIESVDNDFPFDKILACLPDGYIFSKVYGHQSKYPELDDYSLIVTDRNFEIRQLLLPYSSKVFSGQKTGLKYADKMCISTSFSDTIYFYRNDSVFPYKVLDFSSDKLNIDQFQSFQDYIERVMVKRQEKGLRFEGGYSENSTHLIVELVDGHTPYTIFMCKQTGNIASGRFCMYVKENSLSLSAPAGVHNDWFYEVKNASSFPHNTITSSRYISKEDLAKLEQLKDNSNPFIMFYKLKDF